MNFLRKYLFIYLVVLGLDTLASVGSFSSCSSLFLKNTKKSSLIKNSKVIEIIPIKNLELTDANNNLITNNRIEIHKSNTKLKSYLYKEQAYTAYLIGESINNTEKVYGELIYRFKKRLNKEEINSFLKNDGFFGSKEIQSKMEKDPKVFTFASNQVNERLDFTDFRGVHHKIDSTLELQWNFIDKEIRNQGASSVLIEEILKKYKPSALSGIYFAQVNHQKMIEGLDDILSKLKGYKKVDKIDKRINVYLDSCCNQMDDLFEFRFIDIDSPPTIILKPQFAPIVQEAMEQTPFYKSLKKIYNKEIEITFDDLFYDDFENLLRPRNGFVLLPSPNSF